MRLGKFQTLEELNRHKVINSAREIITLATVKITQLISAVIKEDLESKKERCNKEVSKLDAYKEIGFKQLRVEERARKLAEILQVDNALSAQHRSNKEFSLFSTNFKGFSNKEYTKDCFQFNIDTPSYLSVFISKSI